MTRLLVCLSLAVTVWAQQAYPLAGWDMQTCITKGRFQDSEYVHASVMKRVVADEKRSIPILISQITDTRAVKNLVYCYNWGQLQVGELAHFILESLFVNEDWTKSTMPPLFPNDKECDRNTPGWTCWAQFKKRHPMMALQAQWTRFWIANQAKIYWDRPCQCFKLR